MKKHLKILSIIFILAAQLLAFASCDIIEDLTGVVIGGEVDNSDECQHEWAEATCKEPKHCKLCGESEGDSLGHKLTTVSGYAATCDKEGKTDGEACKLCGDMITAHEIITKKDHTPVTVAGYDSTCSKEGKTDGESCKDCGAVIVAQITISTKAHVTEILNGYEATCTEEGLTDGEGCKECGAIIVAQFVIPTTEHIPGAEATCTTDQICIDCGAVIVERHHTPVTIEGYDATCTEEGLTDGEKCTACSEIIKEQEAIPAKGHTPGDDETCDTDKACTECGEVLVAMHHTPVTVNGYPATCTEDGLTDGEKCELCPAIITPQKPIPAKGHTPGAEATCDKDQLCTECETVITEKHHTPTEVKGKDATCTEDGLTDGLKCAACPEIFTPQDVIPANGHTPGAEADCNNDQVCTACGVVLVEKYHVPTAVEGYDSTCTVKGLTDGEKCAICDKILVAQEEIALKPHTEIEVPAVAPTCYETGLTAGVKCEVCDKVIKAQKSVAATGHTFVDGQCINCGQGFYNDGMLFEWSEYYGYYIAKSIGNTTDKDIVIPATYNGKPVGEIYQWFVNDSKNKANFESVTIPSSIKVINGRSTVAAFTGCTNIKKVYIDSIESWFNITFADIEGANPLIFGADLYCGGELVTNLVIPESVTEIRTDLFKGCTSITGITFHDNVYVISGFNNLVNITEINIPSNARIIMMGAFNGCTNLASITIPNSTYHISNNTFKNTAYYNNPDNWDQGEVLYIGNHLITAKTTLSGQYIVREKTTSISPYAFQNCKQLTDLKLNAKLKVIGDYAFSNTNSLKTLVIPSSVVYIGANAFYKMNGGYAGISISFEQPYVVWKKHYNLYDDLSNPVYVYGSSTSTVVTYYLDGKAITGGYGQGIVDEDLKTAICR